MTWANVRFDKDEKGSPLPKTSGLWCEECGAIWSERERIAAIDALMTTPGFGWRQTREFKCCGNEEQVPEQWDDEGRSLCNVCGERSKFDGKAGFSASKIYSKRHRLSDVVQQWMDARGDAEQMRVWSNEAMAELFQHKYTEKFSSNALMARAEVYGPNDVPAGVKLITAFCDTQDNRLEVLVVGYSWDEESYVLLHHVIHGNPSTQPQVWRELDQLRAMTFQMRGSDRILKIEALGVDSAGHNTAAVLAYCNTRTVAGVGQVFATRGQDGPIPLWPHRGSLSKIRKRETFFNIGVSTGKELITARLAMTPPEPGFRKPGFIHFPVGLDLEFYEQLNSERQLRRMRAGQEISFWKKVRERNEGFDMIVGALCVRRYFGRLVGGGNLAIPAEEAMAPTAAPPPSTTPAPATTAAMEPDSDEAEKLKIEQMIMDSPELSNEAILSSMRVVDEVEKGIDPATAAARERCRQMGIGDFDRNRPKQPPVAISESDTDFDEAWLRQVLEKRRAKMAEQAQAQPRGADPAHRRPQQPLLQQRPWPRRHGLYAALED
jgi:hypothetical protein